MMKVCIDKQSTKHLNLNIFSDDKSEKETTNVKKYCEKIKYSIYEFVENTETVFQLYEYEGIFTYDIFIRNITWSTQNKILMRELDDLRTNLERVARKFKFSVSIEGFDTI